MTIVRIMLLVCSVTVGAFAVDNDAASKPVHAENPTEQEAAHQDSGRVGIGFKVGMTGIGFEGATRVTHSSNVRGGFGLLNYKKDFSTNNGVNLNGRFALRTIDFHYDYFPDILILRHFHVSPGLLMFMGNPASATVSADSFTLGNNHYTSDSSKPLNGTINLNWQRKVAPMFTIGTGNLVSRKEGKHFTVPFEVGLAFTGAPHVNYNLTGNICQYSSTYPYGETCGSNSLNAQFQQALAANQGKVNNELKSYKMLKIYPIISLGFGYKF